MIEITDKHKCCGCSACASICPNNCIEMIPDEEGFLYPHIDETKCVECGMCEKVCPVINTPKRNGKPESIIIRNNDSEIVKDSTSGGAFSSFANAILGEKGEVYGALFDSNNKLIHKAINIEKDLYMLRGSKYIQSDINNTYCEVKEKLKSGKTILFSGTPCQIAGLKNFLNGQYEDNLYCIDIVCRGTPSPKVWSEYVSYMEKKYNSKITKALFRNKTYGYHSSTMLIEFENGKKYRKSGRVDPMMRLFTRELCSRPSCSECAFKEKSHISDLTLFDCKKYSMVTGKDDDDKGYTSVLVHSDKGEELLGKVKDSIQIIDADLELLIEKCGIMVCNKAQPNAKRPELFKLLGEKPIDEIVQIVSPISRKDKMIEASKNVLYKTKLINVARKFKKHEDIDVK